MIGAMLRNGQTSLDEPATTAAREHALLELMVESMTDSVFVKDLSGCYVLMNSACAAAMGRPREALIGQRATSVFPDDDAHRQEAIDAAVLAGGKTVQSEYVAEGEDGTRTFHVTKSPVRDGNGVIIGLLGISRDITEQKRMEEQLRASEEKYRSVWDQSPIGKSVTKLTGEVDFNPAMCAMLGYGPDELRNVKFQTLTHPDDVALSEAMTRRLTDGKAERVRFEKRYIRKDGRVVWSEIELSLRRDAAGAPRDFLASVVDVTERHEAEEALRESEDKFRYWFNHASVGMSITALTGEVHFNRAACEMLGRTPAEMRGVRWQDITHPDDIGINAQLVDEMVAGSRDHMRLTKRYLRPDGTLVWADVSSIIRRDADGNPLYLMTSMVDITERKAAEERLRESEYFFRESQRAANIGSYRADFVRATFQCSEVLERIFGVEGELVWPIAAWVSWVHADDRERMSRYLAEDVVGRGERFDAEYRVVRQSDGAVRWLHGLGELERTADGSVVAMNGTIMDITEQRAAQDAMRASEERHRAILQSAMDGFWLLDAKGRILEANDAYARMTGYTVEELVGMHVTDIDAAESFEETLAHIAQIARDGQGRFESRHRRKDGSLFDVAVSVQVRADGSGQQVAFLQDITARKQAEQERAAMQEQLQQAQKMESVGRLAGGVAHDFNNMLGVILGNVDMALEQVTPDHPMHEDLDEARRAAIRSVELTRQLLAFARKQTAAPKVLDLNDTVAGMLKMLQRLIGEDIRIDWRPHTPLWLINIDPSQIDQILANLCVNSRDAIEGPGRLTIATGHRVFVEEELVAHPEAAAGEYVTLSVTDDGQGMDNETLAHLFEPFYTTKAQGKGTGLGLATVWGIVRQNNGFIDVESRLGEGTTFHIHLPRHVGKQAAVDTAEPSAAVPRGRETVLLTEDEPGILALAARMLERQGYHVLRAGSPVEAIRIAQDYDGPIHLLMTDVVMPEMNGRDLAKRLLQLYPDIKRLFMSGYTADVIAHRGVVDEGVHFLQKPFLQEALLRKVREALDGDPL